MFAEMAKTPAIGKVLNRNPRVIPAFAKIVECITFNGLSPLNVTTTSTGSVVPANALRSF